jgi:hypothetical protein
LRERSPRTTRCTGVLLPALDKRCAGKGAASRSNKTRRRSRLARRLLAPLVTCASEFRAYQPSRMAGESAGREEGGGEEALKCGGPPQQMHSSHVSTSLLPVRASDARAVASAKPVANAAAIVHFIPTALLPNRGAISALITGSLGEAPGPLADPYRID